MNGDFIGQFVEKDTVDALNTLLTESDEKKAEEAGVKLAESLTGEARLFKTIADPNADSGAGESKLVSSFHNNLVLLIQKTWVEKSDIDLKAQVLYHLEEFTKFLNEKTYKDAYPLFFSIVDDVVYLMFGAQTKTKAFDEYAMRIDPDFGLFWWYVESLPRDNGWTDGKKRLAVLLGMYYLANF